MEKEEAIKLFEKFKNKQNYPVEFEIVDSNPEKVLANFKGGENKITLIWDMCKDKTEEEIEKIIAHELGHFIHYAVVINKIDKAAEDIGSMVEEIKRMKEEVKNVVKEYKSDESEGIAEEIKVCIMREYKGLSTITST